MDQPGASARRVEPGPVDPARERGGAGGQQARRHQTVGAAVRGGSPVQQPGGEPAAERELDQGGVQRVPEPHAVQGVAVRPERQPGHRAGERLGRCVEELPAGRRVERVAQPPGPRVSVR
ncbi:hypothetical protein GCM10018790_15480 [Kitasatospora xanthocidica]|nr:hypothetical protein GCM10018790_15480 [Kitasatospora xanthocidica]